MIMKISKKNLDNIIKEEIVKLLKERDNSSLETQIQEALREIIDNRQSLSRLIQIVQQNSDSIRDIKMRLADRQND